jgi:hypothetical protein
MSPRGRVYPTTLGKVAFPRAKEAKLGQLRCLPLHPAIPGARFSLRQGPRTYESIVRQTLPHRKPSLDLAAGANGDRAKSVAQKGRPSATRGKSAAISRERAPAARRDFALDPPSVRSADLRLLLRLPDSAFGRAVAGGLSIGFANVRALLGLAVAARA